VKEIHHDRFKHAVLSIFDELFGTLWWIREDLWKKLLRDYDQNSQRIGHPGLSIRKSAPESVDAVIPMLHGRSTSDPLRIEDVSPGKPSFFGHLSPALIPLPYFYRHDPDANREDPEAAWWELRSATANFHKPRVTEEEEERVEAFLQQSGLYDN
jgi:hypothetical protein